MLLRLLLSLLLCCISSLYALSDDEVALIAEGNVLGHTELEGAGLKGYLVDLKRTKNGKPSGLKGSSPVEVVKALYDYFKAGWSRKKLGNYYRLEDALYAPFIYMPPVSARYAPIAAGLGNPQAPESTWECQPSAWLMVYRGTVIAPHTGKFRFIGTGDDFLAVRFKGKTVLEAGYRIPTLYDPKNPSDCRVSYNSDSREKFLKSRKGYEMITGVRGCHKWDNELGGLVAGTPFMVKAGERCPIEIVLSEIPGGQCGFVLFIEDISYGKNSNAKSYDLFRTADVLPDIKAIEKAYKEARCYSITSEIAFNPDSPVWRIAPPAKKKKDAKGE